MRVRASHDSPEVTCAVAFFASHAWVSTVTGALFCATSHAGLLCPTTERLSHPLALTRLARVFPLAHVIEGTPIDGDWGL